MVILRNIWREISTNSSIGDQNLAIAMQLLGVLLAAHIAGAASTQGLQPSSPSEIVTGAQSCLAATGSKQIDESKLAADGWHPASMSENGRPVATPLAFYAKGKLLLTFDKAAASPTCFITAHLPDAETFGDVAYAIDHQFNLQGAAKSGETKSIYWFPKDHIIQLNMTGTSASPSVRVGVGYVSAH